jgi:Second Messenger Oligonucleotide or Dinucleotide Synthetase domain
MSVAEWFSTFCTNILIRDGGTISTRYKAITKRLNSDFWSLDSDIYHSLYVGSYGRNTAAQPFSDLDMIFELPANLYGRYNMYQGNGQSALLQAVSGSLQKTYTSSKVGADGQVIAIAFTDGINFEIVPVFPAEEGMYTFPDANGGGRWRSTNPRPEIKAIRERNYACNGNLIPLSRMMRSWKSKWDVRIGGLLIDTLAYQFIETWQYRDKSYMYYDWMCRDFFKWMSEQNAEQEYWKAPGSGQYVYGKGLFQYKAKRCYNISIDAIQSASDGYEYTARSTWRDIFGTAFPS